MKLKQFIFALVAMLLSFVSPAFAQVAKVGNTEYATIDEAIANWTNGTTLTLLADVTLSDVIKLSSTEYHILDLGTYTMTAKKGSVTLGSLSNKDAIEIVNNGRSKASYALDIKADATNPGGITASGKAVVKTTGKSGVQDRPIIRFYGGVFNGSNVVTHSGSNGTNCPQFWFYGGEFNGTIYANRAKFCFYGGTFNGSLFISVDSSADALVSGGKFKSLSNSYNSTLNTDKFTIGSAAGVYDRGIYVDAEGYYVITSAPITEVSAKYPAVKKESYNSNNYFYYSAAAANGMFYEVASMATGSNVEKYEHAEVVEELDNNEAVKDFTPELPSEVVTFEVEAIDVEATAEATTKVTFNVEPKNASGQKVSNPSAEITFRLPVPAAWSGKANVYHEGTLLGAYTIKEESGANYVEVSSSSFSEFSVEAIVPLFAGEGTEASPYIIDSSDKLAALRNEVNGGEAYAGVFFKLTSDITLSGEWTAIGNGSRSSKSYTGNAFKGVFDGDNNTISGLTITSTTAADAAIGLFGVVDGGTVKNLNLTNVNINVPSSNLAGAAIGMMLNGATADAITVSGAVVGNDGVGGIVGRVIIDGTIENCINNASVTSSYGGIGGIVGKAYYEDGANTATFATVTGCTNKGTITAPMYVGGIAGLARAKVTNCVNEGAVVGGTQTGGIVGQLMAAGTVSGNENKAKVSGKSHVGGIIGDYSQSGSYTYNNVTIANNVNRGELAATEQCAAILGCNNIDGFTAMTATGNQSFYYVEGLELFGNPEDMVIDATNKFILPTVAIVNGQEFSSFAEAITAAQNGETIILIADVKLTAQVVIPEGKVLTLDLNGKTVNSVFNGTSTTNHIYALSNKGTLTIKDSEGNGSINSRGIYNYGSLTLNAGAINAIDGNGGYAVNNQSGSTFVMNGGVVAATYEDDHQSSEGGYDATALKVPAGCTATLNGGTINNVCDFTYAIDAAGTLNIPETSAITVIGTHGAIYVSGGVTTIDAGTFQIPADNYSRTDNVLYVSGGSLVVNGGTFIGDSDTASGGSCLYDAAGKAVVNGGTFKGSSGGDVWGTTGTTIKGGTFENLTEKQHIAAGYELNADGTVAAKPVASINGTKYTSLSEAVAAAQANETITLIADVELAEVVTIPADKTLNIDLNGKAISMQESIITTAYAFNNLGNLKITDGVGGGSINARGIYNGYGNGGDNVATATITVLGGTFNAKGTNGGAAIFNYGTANVNGGKFTSIGGYSLNNYAGAKMNITDGVEVTGGIYNNSNAELIVDGGNISNNRSGCHTIYAWNAKVIVNGGSIHNENSGNATIMSAGTSEVTINGGTISIKDGRVPGNNNTWTSCLTDVANTAQIIVNGGTLNGGFRVQAGTSMTINGGSFNDVYGSNYNIHGTVTVTGGTFTDAAAQTFAKNNIADDYKLGEDGKVVYAPVVAKIGETKYETLDAAFAAATDGQTITMLVDATPALTSQRAITKAAVIDLGGKTMTLKEDDLYFGTTTFKNGTIVVDPSVKPSTAVFWMFANQTLTFDNVKVVATGVTGTYLIGLEGENSDLNLLNGSEILVENTTALDLDIICVNGTNTCDIKVENSKVNVTNLDGRVFFRGNYTVKDSEVNLAGITKAGFRIEAGQTLSIEGTSKVNIEGEPRDGGIHLTDASANYTKAETATVNATVNEPKVAKIGETTYKTLQAAIEAVQEGETITVLEDITFTTGANGSTNGISYTRGASFTLDLNGKTITSNLGNNALRFKIGDGNTVRDTEVTVLIKNGKIVSGSNNWCAISAATADNSGNKLILNLTDLTIEANKAGDFAVKSWAGAVVNTNNVDVTSNYAGGFYAVGGEIVLDENSSVAQKGLHTEPYMSYAFGVSSGTGKMTVNGGTYSAVPAAASDGYNQGVSHGSSVGGVMSSGGTLIINGGTFSNDNFGDAAPTAPRSLIMADAGAVVTINGGTFNAMAKIVDPTNNTGVASKNAVVTIAGGTYSANPTDAPYNIVKLAEDYIAVENNGVWNVVKAAAKIDKQGYATIKDAVAAVKESETITILAGTHSEGTIKLPATLKNVTIKGAEGAELKDMTISAVDGNAYSYVGLTFGGITFDNSRILLTGWRNGDETIKNLAVTNCTFKNLNDNTNTAPIHINKDASEAVNGFTFTNNVIDGATGGSKSGIYAQVTGEVKVENNIINNVSFRPYVIQVTTDDGIADNFTVKGNTFSGSAAGRAQGLGNNAEGTDNVNLVVSNNIFKGITESQQICYWNFNPETTTADLSKNYYDIDIVANPNKIYFNSPAADNFALRDMNVFPIYTALNEDGTINTESAFTPKFYIAKVGENSYETLAEALEAATEGATVTLLNNTTESIAAFNNVKLATAVAGGVTVKNTYGDWIDMTSVAIGTGVTLDMKNVFYKGGENVIEGMLNAATLYNGYDAKTTVQNGGKIATTGMIVNRYHTAADAGIYVYGDGDASTVEVSCANTIGTYSGTFYSKDAVVNGDMLWIDYLKGSTQEADNYSQSKPVFENSTVNITKELRLYKDATLTLVNSDVTAGTVQIRENATPTVNVDANSTVKATSVQNLTGASMDAVLDENGFVSFNSIVAKIGTVKYTSLEAAFKAATSGCTIDILSDVTVDYNWDARYTGGKFTVPVTINGNGKTIKFTASVNDNNYQAPFRFEADATVKNLTIDMSEVTDNRFRAISSKGNLTVDNSKFIGKDETLNCRAIIFGEGAGANVGNLAISITNSEFINWKRGITDNENAQDVKTVTITGNTMTDAGIGVSAKETVTFTGNTVAGAYVNIKSYTAGNKLAVTATGNTLEANTDESGKFNVIDAGGVVNAEGFKVVAKGNNFNGYTGTDGIWGEVWGNARESFVIKVLDANDNVMGTTSLNNVGGIIDGDVNVSWNLKFNAAANTDEYWTMEWTTAPTLNNMPAKVELWVDGTRVGGGPVVLNGPDDLNKINVIVTDAEGKVTSCQTTVANALTAAKDGETVNLLWKDGQAPLAMNGSVFGKNVTITGTAKVDWNKGFLFVGRGGAGNATVTFDGANLTSASNSSSYGIHVSGREKNTTNKYDGTLVIKNSTIELDYLINRNAIELDNATLTVKNGFAIAGRPASETENAANATATISLANGSKVVVNNHNGMGLGQAASVLEGFGVMNVDATSAFETTQGFVVTVNGTMNIAGNATIAGTLTNEGAINLASENAVLKAQAGLTINSTVEGRDVIYADGVYTTKLGLKGKGTEAEPYLIYNVKELVAFRNSVNEGETKYSAPGVYVALAADIDMTGENWVGIGSATADHGFMGNFDGKNFKIKNLTINNPALDNDGYAYAGLFGVTEGTDKDNQNTIKNLTIENVTINTTGDIVSAAIAYPYYTIVDNVKVCGDIKIQGGNYTAGVLAYTRRCVNASNLSIVGNDGSFVKGNQTVGGVISDIQMNGGLTAVYSNFSAEGITVTGEKSVGGIAGIIATQTLNGATVKNVTLSSQDAFAGVVAGRLGGTSTISNVVSENVTGATAVIGATFDGAKAVEAKIGDTYYATLEAALAAQGNEVELLATYEVAAGETKTLDLKGKTVTMVYTTKATKNHTMVSNSGNLTIESSVEGGKLSYTYAGEDLGVSYSTNTVTSNPGSVLTVKSGTIENLTYDKSVIAYAIDGLTNGGAGDVTVNIEGGVITSKRQAVRIFANSTANTGALNISGGDITGRVIVQNANANANKAALEITGGTFNANDYKTDVLYVGGSSSATIDINATVSGGTFNGEITETNVAGFITGGAYKTDVNQFCALGYQAQANAEGLYAVEYTGKVAEFTIVDGEYTEFNIEEDVEVGTLTYTRTIYEGWNALYVPFEIPVNELTNDFEVAYINDMHWVDKNDDFTMQTSEMTMEVIKIKNGTLKANHPYIIRPKNGANIAMNLELNNVILHKTSEKVDVEFSSAYVEYKVSGTYTKAGVDILNNGNDIYIVSGDNFGVMNNAYPLPAFRIFMTVENKEGSPVIIDQSAPIRIRVAGEKDEATGIITPIIEGDVHVNDGTVYDLMGRPVRTPEKGKIYIMNGKKVLF